MIRPASRLAALVLCAAACSGSGHSTVLDAGSTCSSNLDAQLQCPSAPTACDYFLHCGCDPLDKCTAGASGPVCGPAGAKRAGEACAADSECARGTVCVPSVDGTRCSQFCDEAHRCPWGEACYLLVEDLQQPPDTIGRVCAPTCSLVDQDCASGDAGCYRSQENCVREEGICLTAGTGTQGTPCLRMSDCQKGYLCTDPDGPATPICAKICDRVDGHPACDAGVVCQHLSGQTQTGVCLP